MRHPEQRRVEAVAMIRTWRAKAPAPPGYQDVIVSGPAAELDPLLDELELTEGVVGFTRRLLSATGDVAVKVRLRDDGRSPLMLPAADGWLPAVRDHAPVEPVRELPLRASAEIERPVPGTTAYRAANTPWWSDRQRVALAGLAVGAVLGVVVVAVWALVSVVRAGVQAVAQHGDVIVGVLALAIVGFLVGRALLRRAGGCGGLHCTGCSKH